MPTKVSSLGGKYYFDDAQEWPDTMMTTYDYGNGKLLTYEMRIWTPYPLHEEGEGAAVLGDQGSLVIGGSRWRHFGPKGELILETERTKAGADAAHRPADTDSGADVDADHRVASDAGAARAVARFAALFGDIAAVPPTAGSEAPEELRRFRAGEVAYWITGPWRFGELGDARVAVSASPVSSGA